MARIQPGLERISQLVKDIQYPWKSIHVAGTNGKGSVCWYASKLLTRNNIRCGKFTSPHLVDRWDCIQIDGTPVNEQRFRRVERHYLNLNLREGINASPFEILTATAFHIFNEEKVRIGVVEVGMGGRLDATNILQNQVLSIITKIARDHQNFLGNTLREITLHKAGILRPMVPFVVNKMNEGAVKSIIEEYAEEIGAGPCIDLDSPELQSELYRKQEWKSLSQPLRPFQRDNALLGVIAAREAAEALGRPLLTYNLLRKFLKAKGDSITGRAERVKVQPVFGFGNPDGRPWDRRGKEILIDGAHNVDAAKSLQHLVQQDERSVDTFVPKLSSSEKRKWIGHSVTWVLAMTDGKDAQGYLETLLRSGDRVITTSFGPVDGMPWVKPMDPKKLLAVAKAANPDITGLAMPKEGVLRALCASKYLTPDHEPIVMTGSLYLIGEFYREIRINRRHSREWLKTVEFEEDRKYFETIHREERRRINQFLSNPEDAASRNYEVDNDSDEVERARERRIQDADRLERERRSNLQLELAALDREMETLDAEEERLLREEPEASTEPSPSDEEQATPEVTEEQTESLEVVEESTQSPEDAVAGNPSAEITHAENEDPKLEAAIDQLSEAQNAATHEPTPSEPTSSPTLEASNDPSNVMFETSLPPVLTSFPSSSPNYDALVPAELIVTPQQRKHMSHRNAIKAARAERREETARRAKLGLPPKRTSHGRRKRKGPRIV